MTKSWRFWELWIRKCSRIYRIIYEELYISGYDD